jgi:hemoglobin
VDNLLGDRVMIDASNDATLFERLGGSGALEELVAGFYQRVTGDPVLAPFFEGVAMESLQKMQAEFLAMVLGGPVSYTGRPLAHVHHGRGITASQVAAFAGHLLEELRARGVSDSDCDAVISRVDRLSNEVTGTSY